MKLMRAEVGISNSNIKFYSMNYRFEKKAINIIHPSMFLFYYLLLFFFFSIAGRQSKH